MNKCLQGVAVLCLAALWVGCQQSADPVVPAAPASSAQATDSGGAAASGEFTLVKLKVPNMT